MASPVVSIVLPTYSRVNLLKLSIESVLSQSFRDWELLVIDDGSLDGTDKLMKEFAEKDSRIRYLKIPRSTLPGISYYLNFGIKSSRGKYIARIDDDDTWCYGGKLKQQVEFLDSNPDYVLVGGGVNMVDSNNKEFRRYIKKEKDEEIRKYALLSCPFDHPTIMFRKDISESIGNYKILKVAEDWEFFLRLGRAGKFYNFQLYYTNYLQAGQNISLKDDTEIAKTELRIIKTYRYDYPNYYLGVMLHCAQYFYSFLPNFFKVRFQYFIRYLKRKLF